MKENPVLTNSRSEFFKTKSKQNKVSVAPIGFILFQLQNINVSVRNET